MVRLDIKVLEGDVIYRGRLEIRGAKGRRLARTVLHAMGRGEMECINVAGEIEWRRSIRSGGYVCDARSHGARLYYYQRENGDLEALVRSSYASQREYLSLSK